MNCEDISFTEKINDIINTYLVKHVEIIARATNQSVSEGRLAEEREEVATLKKLICEVITLPDFLTSVPIHKIHHARRAGEGPAMCDVVCRKGRKVKVKVTLLYKKIVC